MIFTLSFWAFHDILRLGKYVFCVVLEGEANQIRGKEELHESSLNELKDETKGLKKIIEELKKRKSTVLDLEKRTADQEQYWSRESVWCSGFHYFTASFN